MYVNSLNDRQNLGFSCVKDVRAAEQISNLAAQIAKLTELIVIQNGEKVLLLVFSKEVLIGVFIFIKSTSPNAILDFDVYRPSNFSSEVSTSVSFKSKNFGFNENFKSFKSPSSLDLILKLNGGSEEDLNEEDEKLLKSVLAKTPQSNYRETSINKYLKKVVRWIEPIISDSTFWRIVN